MPGESEPVMRKLAVILVLLGLHGCGESPDDEAPVIVNEFAADASPFDAFARIPQRLHHGLRMRKSHVDHIAIEDIFTTQFESEELVALLEKWLNSYVHNHFLL